MFIRTKNGIYELTDSGNVCYPKLITKGNKIKLVKFVRKTTVIKQAETIAELVDEFVCVDNLDNHTSVGTCYPKTFHMLRKGYQVYGAIWTDKGLIYVAKMNEKGELELL